MDRWSQLSMSEKSDLMSLYIRNGISSLEEIKKHYNSFATGGHLYQDGGPDDDKYSFLRREPEVAVADNTRYVRPITDVEIDRASGLPEGTTTMRRIISAQADRQQPVIKQDNTTTETHESINKEIKKAQTAKKVNDVANAVAAVTSIPATIVAPEVMTPIFALQGFNDATDVLSKEGNLNTEDYGRLGLDALFMLPMFNTAGNYLRFNTNLGRSYELSRALNKSIKNTELPQRTIENPANSRFKLGDVEMNDPKLFYHLDFGDYTSAYNPSENIGSYVKDGYLYAGKPKVEGQLGYSWWNKGEPFATKSKELQFQRLHTTTDNPNLLHVRSQNYPIGQWDGKSGFIRNSEYVASEPVKIGTQYQWEPGYGYRRANEFIPTLEEAFDIANTAKLSYPSNILRIPQHVSIEPQIKPLIQGAEIEKQLSKTGTVSRKSLDAYIAKQSNYYQEVMNDVLESEFKGIEKIDYTQFKDAVQKRLSRYDRKQATQIKEFDGSIDTESYGILPNEKMDKVRKGLDYDENDIDMHQFVWESSSKEFNPRFSNEHYEGIPIGHTRTFTVKSEPENLYIAESQSDWAQHYIPIKENKIPHLESTIEKSEKEISYWKNILEKNTDNNGNVLSESVREQIQKEFIPNAERRLKQANADLYSAKHTSREKHLADNYYTRQIQENLKYASENGYKTMRYPAPETAAKIQRYPKNEINIEDLDYMNSYYGRLPDDAVEAYVNAQYDNNFGEMLKILKEHFNDERLNNITLRYNPKHETIIKKYSDFPKQFQKLFGKKAEVRTVTDSKGNTWYEVDVPESYRNGTGQIIASLNEEFGNRPIALTIPKIVRQAKSDLDAMNLYHDLNVAEYNAAMNSNIESIPFRTNIGQARVMPKEDFIGLVKSRKTNTPGNNPDNVGGFYNHNDDMVYIPNITHPSNVYHEYLHQGRYGITNPEITRWRINQLVDKKTLESMKPEDRKYFMSEVEFPVHLRQQGEKYGIKVGEPYPGEEAFDKLIEEKGIGGAAYYVKRDTPEQKELFWKALNGTLFGSIPIGVGIGISQFQSN